VIAARRDLAAATDGEHAPEVQRWQRDLGRAALECELEPRAEARRADEPDRSGDDPGSIRVRHELDAVRGDVTDPDQVRGERATRDDDPANAAAARGRRLAGPVAE
jgi:hypothetical protein